MGSLPKIRHLSIHEAAEHLGLSTKTLRRWEASGKLVAVRTRGGHRRYLLSDLTNLGHKRAGKIKKEVVKQIIYKVPDSIITPFSQQPVELYKPFELHPDQKRVLKTIGYVFFSFLFLAALYKSEPLFNGIRVAQNSLTRSLGRSTALLPIPGVGKTVLYSYQEEFGPKTSTLVSGGEKERILAL